METANSLFPGMRVGNLVVMPLRAETREGFRGSANQVAHNVFVQQQGGLACNETLDHENIAPRVREEVSERELENLQTATSNFPHLYNKVWALKNLIRRVDEKIEIVDFSNGYEEEVRNQANFKEMEGLFRTFVTVQNVFEQSSCYLADEGKSSLMQEAYRKWADAEMGNLVIRLLREVANNNRDSRKGQLVAHPENLMMRSYICERIEALNEVSNPRGWKEAALFDLEKFFSFPSIEDRERLDEKQLEVIQILYRSIQLLRHYF